MKTRVTDLFLYRWRYRLGYVFVTLVGITVITLTATLVPAALREGEIQSAITSGALSIKSLAPSMVIDWPYHVLQRGSFMLFGVTTLSIKLPSLVIGFFTVIGIFMLVRSWFRRNIAIIVTILAVTMTPFLFMIQDGTSIISFTALTIWLLVAGTYVTRGAMFGTFWKVLGCVLLAMSLYTPLGVYLTIALIITASLHPHIRYVIRRIAKPRLILAVVLGLLSIAPLVYAIYLDHTVAARIFGIPSGGIDIGANLVTAGQSLFGFFSTSDTFMLRPIFSLPITLLMLIGIYKLLTVKYTARSYVVLILGAVLSIIVVINPAYVFNLFPIAVLIVAMGITTLIVDWYKLFPRNPYARIAGLVPLAVLVVGLAFSGTTQYVNSYLYNPNILAHYTYDLKLLNQTLGRYTSKEAPIQLIASEHERSFYDLVAHYDGRFHVTIDYLSRAETSLVTREVRHAHLSTLEPSLIITSKQANEADRFYLYKPATK
ncbi:MAG: glycosyltransferase family 39 protein [Candidatus Saccharimonas sp.]